MTEIRVVYGPGESDVAMVARAARDAAQAAQEAAEGAQDLAETAAGNTAIDASATAADRVQTGLDAATATAGAGTATTRAGEAAASAGTATTQASAADAARLAAQLAATNVTAAVANAAPSYTTWAGITAWVATAADQAIAILTTNDAGYARGQYRKISGVAVWEADTLPGVDGRVLAIEARAATYGEAVPIGGEIDANGYPGYLVYTDRSYRFLGAIYAPALFDAVLTNTVTALPDAAVTPVWTDASGNRVMSIDPLTGDLEIYLTRDAMRFAMGRASYTREQAYALLASTLWASTALAGFADISPTLIRGQVWDRGRWTSVIINRAYPHAAMDESVASIEYAPSHGQSLNQGTSDNTISLPNPVDPHNSLTLNTGTIGAFALTGDEALVPGNVFYLRAAYEVLNATRGLSESMGTAMMGSLSEREIAAGALRGVRLYIAHGKGGQTIAQLSKGAGWFENGIAYAQRAKAVALSQFGKATFLRCLHWEQGQADRGLVAAATQDRGTYLAALQQLRVDYDADIRVGVFGSSRALLLTIGQLTSNGSVSSADDQLGASVISLAMLDAVEADATAGHVTAATQLHAITTADYMLQGLTYGYLAGGPHLYAGGYDIKGEYQAKVRDWIFRQGRWWTGLRPSAAPSRVGSVITVPFYVPVPPMVFDTTTLPDFAQFSGAKGFVFRDSAGVVAISSAVITDDGTGSAPGGVVGIGKVVITLAAPPSGVSQTLEYAYRGSVDMTSQYRSAAWGNLRDSHADASKYVAGVTLWNWGLIFRKDVV